jgi:hypothetical protein
VKSAHNPKVAAKATMFKVIAARRHRREPKITGVVI